MGSSCNPAVMSVAHADQNDSSPFSHSRSYQQWPADPSHWAIVFQVSGSFNTDDPLLWTPLVTPEARAQAFRDNTGRCWDCHGTDYSLTRCPRPFINGSGCRNPHLGQVGDNCETYRRSQKRMRSDHRRRTRSSSSSDRRRISSRRNNDRNGNNDGGNTHEPPRKKLGQQRTRSLQLRLGLRHRL